MATAASAKSPRNARMRKVKFGDVTVTAPAPPKEAVERSIALSTLALERLSRRIAKPGVVLRAKKDVPLFSVDGDEPDVIIRRLNGRIERGTITNGEFKAVD